MAFLYFFIFFKFRGQRPGPLTNILSIFWRGKAL